MSQVHGGHPVRQERRQQGGAEGPRQEEEGAPRRQGKVRGEVRTKLNNELPLEFFLKNCISALQYSSLVRLGQDRSSEPNYCSHMEILIVT